jgi:hypothetical protein
MDSLIHVATEDTFFRDSEKFEAQCFICRRVATLEWGWVGIRCSCCKKTFDDEGGMSRIVKQRRQLLGLTRRQMGEKTGYKASTIKKYEWVWCTKNYAEATEKLILESEIKQHQ